MNMHEASLVTVTINYKEWCLLSLYYPCWITVHVICEPFELLVIASCRYFPMRMCNPTMEKVGETFYDHAH